jgi:hypothetical protein
MATITRSTLVEAAPAHEAVHMPAPKLEVIPGTSPRRRLEKWLLGGLIIAASVFAVAFANFVLRPASTTVVSTSTSTWNQDGP